ncbi:MAG: hypothetical protein U5L09_16475 [Bacteroidales bacterium]|nr:hypothetical protein [Bacteroidales bacterium]
MGLGSGFRRGAPAPPKARGAKGAIQMVMRVWAGMSLAASASVINYPDSHQRISKFMKGKLHKKQCCHGYNSDPLFPENQHFYPFSQGVITSAITLVTPAE